MIKNAFLALALCALLAIVSAASFNKEDQDVQDGCKSAFQKGMESFGAGIRREQEEQAKEAAHAIRRPFSHYTAKIESLSGGKPALVEQYRKHNYVPYAPSVLPPKFPRTPDGKYNAEQTAEIFKIRGAYSPKTDRVFIP